VSKQKHVFGLKWHDEKVMPKQTGESICWVPNVPPAGIDARFQPRLPTDEETKRFGLNTFYHDEIDCGSVIVGDFELATCHSKYPNVMYSEEPIGEDGFEWCVWQVSVHE
jgi:hypothetical protein